MRLIKREIHSKIEPWISRPEIIVITGSRQVGKTTLLKMILNELPDGQKMYLDLEDLRILEICNSGVEFFIQYLKLHGYNPQKRFYVGIDEIQYLENPSNFLKLLYDHHPSLKLIVTGSSTMEIKQKFKDSLTGRKIVFELDTFSFSEFLNFKSESLFKVKKRLGSIDQILKGQSWKDWALVSTEFLPHLFEYLTFGGYPKPCQEETQAIKTALIDEIYSSYVRKDIRDIGRITNISAFNNLIKLLAHQIGNLVNFKEISNTLQLNLVTTKKFLFLLENTFIISLCRPFFKNKRKEISKMPKIYFLDLGLRNAISGNFQWAESRQDLGALLENFVFLELKRQFKINEKLHYWRTLAKAEVDFIIQLDDASVVPVEVKALRLQKPAVSRSFHNFIQQYKPNQGIVINLNYVGQTEINGCKITFIPPMAV